MLKLLFYSIIFSLLTSNVYSQWTYGAPFSLSPPNSSLVIVTNKQPKTFMYDSLTFPYPTNRWFMNLILPSGSYGTPQFDSNIVGRFGVYTLPYCVGFAYNYPVGNPIPYKMLKVDYAPYNITTTSGDSASVAWRNSFTMFFGTLDSARIKPFLKSFDDFSATIRWRDTITPNVGYMEAPLVRGMPYATMNYVNMRPFIATPAPPIVSVNGINVLGSNDSTDITGTKFVLLLNGNIGTSNRQLWVLYSSTSVTMRCKNSGLRFIGGSFTGYLRLAYVTTRDLDPNAADSTARIQLLDKYSKFYPTGGTFAASMTSDTTRVTMNFNFQTNVPGNDSLLMIALPHHVPMLTNSTSNIFKFQCLKGPMTEVHGKVWTMNENLTKVNWYPLGNLNAVPPNYRDTLYRTLVYDYDTICGTRAFPHVPNGNNQTSNDVYGFGKTGAKYGRLAVIADELLSLNFPQCDSIGRNIRDTLKYNLNSWLNGRANPIILGANLRDSLMYDTKYGGIISSLSYDQGYYQDFGNAFYNDHHLQYGYWAYMAAAIARKDPAWVTQYGSKVVDILRDIGNPSSQDPYFTPHRMLDWYDGNSWANGMYDAGAGRNQESSSEATNAWYGMYLYGMATNNQNIKNTGRLMLASEIRAARYYYHIDPSNSIYPPSYTNFWHIVGNLWHSLITNSTFFGKKTRYVYGIQIIPTTPATEELWSHAYSKEVYDFALQNDSVFMWNGQITTGTFNWTTICVGAQAYGYPDTALVFYNKYRGFAGNFDGGASKTNVLYWILTRKFNPSIGIQLNGNTLPFAFKLYQSYPNPFNPVTNIKFDIPKSGMVKLVIYDLLGREVQALVNGELKAGSYKADWNASNFASGVYFYKIEIRQAGSSTVDFIETKKMIFIK